MLVGVPKEIKNHEYRVGLVPSSVAELIHHGHQVIVQTGAGLGARLRVYPGEPPHADPRRFRDGLPVPGADADAFVDGLAARGRQLHRRG